MKAELRKEYEAIAQQFASSIYDCTGLGEAHDTVRNAVTACQELADRPPKELTDAEISEAWHMRVGGVCSTREWTQRIRDVIAAHIAKQREPQVVKFRALRSRDDGSIVMVRADAAINLAGWEWLEPAQEFEVKLP